MAAPGSTTILIADDSPVQVELLRRVLEGAGYEVIAAHDGAEGLVLAKVHRPAAVVSDINMPIMDGYAMCGAIRREELLRATPVILLTVLSDPRDVIRGLNAGADGYVTKPYNEPYLLSRLAALLAEPLDRDHAPIEMETKIGGVPFMVHASAKRVLNLLVSTYESAVLQNRALAATQDDLRATAAELAQANAELERRVAERTAELELSRQRQQEERELTSMQRISRAAQASVTEQSFGVLRLRESAPEFLDRLVQRFEGVLNMALEQRVLRVDHPIGAELRNLAEQLGAIRAVPRDAIDIYVQALNALSRNVPPQKAQAYAEEGRLLLLELMGDLASFYRNYFTGSARNGAHLQSDGKE